ncbi:MAG: hypothetical protein GTO18_18325 [Anaerolineales bacterium]|nr:hypothetical protein [Anaerolineales bacterium]
MKHQPFESWLFQETELEADQLQELEEHIAECESCYMMATSRDAVDEILRKPEMVGPVPGFSQRWLERQQVRQRFTYTRQTSIAMGLLAVVTAVFFGFLLFEVAQLVASSQALVIETLRHMLEWIQWLSRLSEFVGGFVKVVVETVPTSWWAGLGFCLVGVGAVWMASVYVFRPKYLRKGV